MGICQMCPGDSMEFAVNLNSLKGVVDVGSITWYEPTLVDTPLSNTLTYNKDLV